MVERPSGTPTPITVSTGSPTPIETVPGDYQKTKICSDYDGDGQSDIALIERSGSSHRFHIKLSKSGKETFAQFGEAGSVPISADYDGDGKTDLGFITPGRELKWSFANLKAKKVRTFVFGNSGDLALSGCDIDGDGGDDLAVISKGKNLRYFNTTTMKGKRIKLPHMIRNAREILCSEMNGSPGDELIMLAKVPGTGSVAGGRSFALHTYSTAKNLKGAGTGLVREREQLLTARPLSLVSTSLDGKTPLLGIIEKAGKGFLKLSFLSGDSVEKVFDIPRFTQLFIHRTIGGEGVTLLTKRSALLRLDFRDEDPKVLEFENQLPELFELLTCPAIISVR